MQHLNRLVLPLLLLALSGVSRATDWELSLDTRLVSSDAYPSYMEGGLGTVRFGSDDSGVRLGRARFAVTQAIGERWSAHLDASVFDDQGGSLLGLTEAYLLFRPYPFSGYRFRLKAGGFYPPVSLENRSSGWESPYTLSYSSINSWLAVEVRTVGLEGTLDWLGTRLGHSFDLGVTGGVFGWNDGAGVVIANNGFVFTDRQTPLFGRVGQPGVKPLNGAEPFMEMDHRAGAYAGVEARYLDRAVLRVLRYDNRADPTQIDTVSHAIAWDTRFTSAGLRLEAEHGWTAIVQWLDGVTIIKPRSESLEWPFRAEFALLSKRFGRSTLSARYDHFSVSSNVAEFYGTQDGHAWTAAYVFDANAHWRFTLECVRVVSSSTNRQEQGGPPSATETQWQLALRYAIGSGIR
jgi:Phosphate-selective porin O and P